MADIIVTGVSGYGTGEIDTATILVNNVSPRDAKHPNGCASAAVQIETILGSGLTLKGTATDLASRLSVALKPDGTILLAGGFSDLITDRGLIAQSTSTMAVLNHSPIGIVCPFAGITSPPANWLLCDGTAVSRTTYAKLFAILSTQYGAGNGVSTFNLPDLRGRVIIMVDGAAGRITSVSTGGVNADTLGGTGGAERHALTVSELATHDHDYTPLTINRGTTGGGATGSTINATGSNSNLVNVPSTATTGSSTPHSNTQPWMALQYIIYAGV